MNKKNRTSSILETVQVSQLFDEERAHPEQRGPFAWFVQLAGKNIGRTYAIESSSILLGRGEGPDTIDIELDEATISRVHAKVERRGTAFFILDQNSTNGIFLQGNKIKEHQLEHGNMVQFGGEIVLQFVVTNNIEAYLARDRVLREATIDGLTEIFNKKYFLGKIENEMKTATQDQVSLCLVMFDIDHFKKTNDTFGHQAGDFVLTELAGLVKKKVREWDIFSRYGGEEFAIILPRTNLEGAFNRAEQIRISIAEHSFLHKGKQISTTISMGVCQFSDGMSADDFIVVADKKLYQSKHEGRNKVSK